MYGSPSLLASLSVISIVKTLQGSLTDDFSWPWYVASLFGSSCRWILYGFGSWLYQSRVDTSKVYHWLQFTAVFLFCGDFAYDEVHSCYQLPAFSLSHLQNYEVDHGSQLNSLILVHHSLLLIISWIMLVPCIKLAAERTRYGSTSFIFSFDHLIATIMSSQLLSLYFRCSKRFVWRALHILEVLPALYHFQLWFLL